MALAWLIRENIGDINVYGMDLMRTGYFDGRPKEERRNVGVHDFDIEEAYIKKLQKEGAFNMNSKSAKKISNKAILEPKEYKGTIKCKSCGTVMEYKGYKRGCPVCNTING
jgi:rubrerythrin